MKQLQRKLLSTGGGITSISNRLSPRIYNGKLFIPESRRLMIRSLYPRSRGVFRWNNQSPKIVSILFAQTPSSELAGKSDPYYANTFQTSIFKVDFNVNGPSVLHMINEQIIANAPDIRRSFESALPFRHVQIDGFLKPEICEGLLRDFPSFDKEKAMNELGHVGGKAVTENVSSISPFYAKFYEYINSKAFLQLMSDLTGVPELFADETLFGGGTHENLDGQYLDAHIDFNIDERRMLHRRLNLLIYLNKEWEEPWGGSIELHSNPRIPETNEIKGFVPLFNRAVIFETNEYSWHGFPVIRLPQDKKHLSRKSFSIYLYTKDRPAEEVVAPHTTFYVARPFPSHVKSGQVLAESDYQYLRGLMANRDGLIQMYQDLLIQKEQRLRDFLQARQRKV